MTFDEMAIEFLENYKNSYYCKFDYENDKSRKYLKVVIPTLRKQPKHMIALLLMIILYLHFSKRGR